MTAQGNPVKWAQLYHIDPRQGGLDHTRVVADKLDKETAPHYWQALGPIPNPDRQTDGC